MAVQGMGCSARVECEGLGMLKDESWSRLEISE